MVTVLLAFGGSPSEVVCWRQVVTGGKHSACGLRWAAMLGTCGVSFTHIDWFIDYVVE